MLFTKFRRNGACLQDFLANEGESFESRMDTQRNRTDSTLQQFYKEIKTKQLSSLVALHRQDLDQLNSYFERIPSLRKKY